MLESELYDRDSDDNATGGHGGGELDPSAPSAPAVPGAVFQPPQVLFQPPTARPEPVRAEPARADAPGSSGSPDPAGSGEGADDEDDGGPSRRRRRRSSR